MKLFWQRKVKVHDAPMSADDILKLNRDFKTVIANSTIDGTLHFRNYEPPVCITNCVIQNSSVGVAIDMNPAGVDDDLICKCREATNE